MRLICGGIYRHKYDEAYSIVAYTDKSRAYGYFLLTHVNSHDKICNQLEKSNKGQFDSNAYWYASTEFLDDYFDGYIGNVNRNTTENMRKDIFFNNEVNLYSIDLVRTRLFENYKYVED